MKIAGLYDALSEHYNKSCSYGIIDNAQVNALKQLQKHLAKDSAVRVLDVGVGAADFFQKFLVDYPNAILCGLDLSEKMLISAQQKVPFEGIKGSVHELEKYIKPQSKDVVAAHFIGAYVSADELFKKCNPVLQPGGYMTLLTTTFESFTHFQSDLAVKAKSRNPIDHFIHTMVVKGISKTHCPRDMQDIERQAAAAGFEVIEKQQLVTEVILADEHEALEFVYNDGWGVNVAAVPLIPYRLARLLTLILLKRFSYPFVDTMVVDAVLLQKK